MKKVFISIVTILTILFISVDTSAQTASADSVKKTVVVVGNLLCNGDMPAIKKQLLNQDGIDEVIFTKRAGESSTFTIVYHSSVITKEQIEKIIESTPGCDDKSTKPYKVKKGNTLKNKKS